MGEGLDDEDIACKALGRGLQVQVLGPWEMRCEGSSLVVSGLQVSLAVSWLLVSCREVGKALQDMGASLVMKTTRLRGAALVKMRT